MSYRPRVPAQHYPEPDLPEREEPDEPGCHDLALPYQAAIWLGIWLAVLLLVFLSAIVLKVLLWAMS